MTRVACIGSQETNRDLLEYIGALGVSIVRLGGVVASGNAPGADQAWARGGNLIDPSRVELCLPWKGFEKGAIHSANRVRVLAPPAEDPSSQYYFDIAEAAHPTWGALTVPGRYLHARNVMIVKGSAFVVGSINHQKRGGGGTGSAFRIAKLFEIPTYDITNQAVLDRLIRDLPALVQGRTT